MSRVTSEEAKKMLVQAQKELELEYVQMIAAFFKNPNNGFSALPDVLANYINNSFNLPLFARMKAKDLIEEWKQNKKLTETQIKDQYTKVIACAIIQGTYIMSRVVAEQALSQHFDKMTGGSSGSGMPPIDGGNGMVN